MIPGIKCQGAHKELVTATRVQVAFRRFKWCFAVIRPLADKLIPELAVLDGTNVYWVVFEVIVIRILLTIRVLCFAT